MVQSETVFPVRTTVEIRSGFGAFFVHSSLCAAAQWALPPIPIAFSPALYGAGFPPPAFAGAGSAGVTGRGENGEGADVAVPARLRSRLRGFARGQNVAVPATLRSRLKAAHQRPMHFVPRNDAFLTSDF